MVRLSVLSLALCMLAACAPYKPDPSADVRYYDSRTSTGSNIPKKGSAIIVDKSVVEEQISRQGGNPINMK